MILDDSKYLNPPNNEAEKIFECYSCGGDICEGDTYYEINNFEYCEDCVKERTAEKI